jgi:tetratricopeptide (TPR) repeat protein
MRNPRRLPLAALCLMAGLTAGRAPADATNAAGAVAGAAALAGTDREAIELIELRAKSGDWPGAAALCRQELARNPRNMEARLHLAGLYSVVGDENGAYREARAVLDQDPRNARAHLVVADAALKAGLPSMSARHALAGLENPGSVAVELRRLLGQAYLAEGSVTNARAVLEEVLKVRPDDVDALVQIGSLYAQCGDDAKAETAFGKAAELQPSAPGVMLARGQWFMLRGKADEAIAAYRAVLAKGAAHPVALNNLAILLGDKGQTNEAVRLATQAWQTSPDAPMIADTLGWLYVGQKDYDRAAPLLAYAARRMPRSPEVLYHLGALLFERGQRREAERHLDAALAIASHFRGSDAARALLDRIRANAPKP